MPQSAAPMLGLILVAASIGFNMMHWPSVGRLVAQVEKPSPSAEAVDTKPSPEKPSPATVAPAAAPKPVQPARDIQEMPIRADSPAKVEEPATVREKPLVPIPPIQKPTMPTAVDTLDNSVRRLPPVGEERPAFLRGNDTAAGAAIPIYPSTGVE